MISTREAVVADAPEIADAHTAAWSAAYRGIVDDAVLDDPQVAEGRLDRWCRRLENGPPPTGDVDNKIFVPVIDGRVVGFGHVGREARPPEDHPGRGEVYGFYLHPDSWGSGAADPLMEACAEELSSRFDEAVLWVLRDNPRARRFYERHSWICGNGDDLVETTWDGPVAPGTLKLTTPLAEVQYRITLA